MIAVGGGERARPAVRSSVYVSWSGRSVRSLKIAPKSSKELLFLPLGRLASLEASAASSRRL